MDDDAGEGFAGFIDNIKKNPVLMGLVAVVVLLAIYFIHKKVAGNSPASPANNTANPSLVPITYQNTYNSYPTVQPPPDNDPKAPPVVKPPDKDHPPVPVHNPPKPETEYYTVTAWPHPGSSLSSIASIEHTTVSKLELLNPSIKNPNLLVPGQRIRVS